MKNLKPMKKILVIMATLLLVCQMMTVYAATITPSSTTISANAGSPQTVNVTRKVSNVMNPVTNTFGYTITADDAYNPAAVTGYPTTFQIEFDSEQPDATNVATVTEALSFANATFSKVGDYRFVISEVSSTYATSYPVSTSTYYIHVQVVNEVDPATNTPTGRLKATLATQGTLTNDNDETKTDIEFPANTSLTYITLKKNVVGNMADTEEYFKFKIDILADENDGVFYGDQYVISGQDAQVTYHGEPINTSTVYTVGQENYVYLKHGQTITIGYTGTLSQIHAGTTYTITEMEATDYTTTINGTINGKVRTVSSANSTPAVNTTTFVNKKEASTPTGLFLNIVPFVLVIVAAVVALIVFVKFTKNK